MPPRTELQRRMGEGTVSQQISRFFDDPAGNAEFLAKCMQAIENAKKSYGFDPSAPTTINRRKLHLHEYEQYMKIMAKVENRAADDAFIWGKENVDRNLRAYLNMAALITKPRAYESEVIKLSTLIQRRDSMLYWWPRKCPDELNRGKLFSISQEALGFAYRSLGTVPEPAEKHYLTRLDMVKLIEHDMATTNNPELSQQHHVCWIMGFICGVRPGTIGVAKKRENQFLRWKDIQIRRLGEKGSGNFETKIVFHWLKGYRDERRKSLTFTCAGPTQVEEIMCSLGHRLLALLLRRQLLVKHNSIESLMAGDEVLIQIRPEALDLPVVCRSTSKGLEIQRNKPISSQAISEYVHRRSLDFGLPAGVTHYAWRRSAATRIGETQGADTAREFLGHDSDSRSFETSYKQGPVALDVFGLGMGRGPLNSVALLEPAGLGVNRIKQFTQDKRKFIRDFIAKDQHYLEQEQIVQEARLRYHDQPDDAISLLPIVQQEEKKLAQIHRSRHAQAALAFQRVELHLTEISLTTEDRDKRIAEMKEPGALESMLVQAAKNISEDAGADPTVEMSAQATNAYEMEDLQDARDQPDEEADIHVRNLSDTAVHEHHAVANVDAPDDMAAACKAFLDVLTGQVNLVQNKQHCKLCLEDPTIPQESKDVLYHPAKLSQHLASNVHTPKMKFLRKYKEPCDCPFGCGLILRKGAEILSHVYISTTQSDEHLLAAARAGLFARDFDPGEPRSSRSVVRLSGGIATREQSPEPTVVPFEALVPPANIIFNTDATSHVVPRRPQVPLDASLPVLRLPTIAPIIETAWWRSVPNEDLTDVERILQEQRRWIVIAIDKKLRAIGHGRAGSGGETRSRARAGGGELRRAGIAFLRNRLANELNWSWADNEAEMEDEEAQADEDADEGAGEGAGSAEGNADIIIIDE